ncbi:MAG TPA: protein phosphatase 2C domain-containing protein [Armatimonadota bacterium]|jgi:serine/threonine protein phosphatase PrpC
MRIHAVGCGSQGNVREKNDDFFCVGPFIEQTALTAITLDETTTYYNKYGVLAAVADGIGGYQGGRFASQIVLETFSAQFYSEQRDGCEIRELAADITRYLRETQRILEGKLSRNSSMGEAGTTLAGIVLMPPDYLVIFHAGDSRVLRASGGFIRALTIDHTLVGADVDAGRLSEQEALAVEGGDRLTRSLGRHGDSRVEVNIDLAWGPMDRFFICTDGFHGLGRGIPRAQIRDTMHKFHDMDTLAVALIEEAVKRDGRDNATLIIVDIQDTDNKHGG